MRKTTSLALILASAISLTTLAIAAPGSSGGDFHHGHGGNHGMRDAFSKLNLTDAQRASIKQITSDSRAQNKSQFQALHQQREAFESMTPDQVGYQAAAASLAQTEGDATKLRVQQRAVLQAKIYAVLTPTQKAQLATMRTEREAKRAQWQQFKEQNPVAPASSSAQ